MFVFPVPELAKALCISPGEAANLHKSSYGLVDAPMQWYVHVVAELKGLKCIQLDTIPMHVHFARAQCQHID